MSLQVLHYECIQQYEYRQRLERGNFLKIKESWQKKINSKTITVNIKHLYG